MPFSRQTAQGARLISFATNDGFPAKELQDIVYQTLIESKHSRVAVMADEESLDGLPELDSDRLDPKEDYYWTGIHVRRGLHKVDRRVIVGTYEDWFRWYMRNQRFRAFQTLVLIEPLAGVSDEEHGGYIDGLLARLMGKVRRLVIISSGGSDVPSSKDELRAREVIRSLLYGTRLTRPEVFRQLGRTFIPIEGDSLSKVFTKYSWRISREHPRYKLDEDDEELLQGMVGRYPHRPDDFGGNPYEIKQLFRRKRRFKPELKLPEDMIVPRIIDDAVAFTWVTPPFEAGKLEEWLHELNRQEDPRLDDFRSHERVSDEEWLRLLSPRKGQVREVLDALVAEGRLVRTTWYLEVGRPAFAYSLPGMIPFLSSRCGQCAFYVPSKTRCRLWHLANHTVPFFHPRWNEPGSKVMMFEKHKMKFASRIGPHSSACQRFLYKKRDHLRKAIPDQCETCGSPLPRKSQVLVTCQSCKTRYVKRWDGKVRVLVAYGHEFSRVYHEATGGEAKADFEAYKRDVKESFRTAHAGMPLPDEVDDALAEESDGVEPEPPRARPEYSPSLQEKVEGLTQSTDVARQLSIAMAKSALTATKRILAFSKVRREEAEPLLARQERFLRLIESADRSKLLPYEAQVMKQYWLCYGLPLRGAPQIWFGPRKRSRFVREYVGSEAGRARGYSPVDSAINYVHQRRRQQAERINAEVGFPGNCDGFLHRESYNSRKIGLLLDMIDPFKFADREELLIIALDQGLTWKDFRIEADRRGSNFYYPTDAARFKLDQAGAAADGLIVRYQEREMRLSEAYQIFAESMLQALSEHGTSVPHFDPFVFEFPEDSQ